MQVYETTFIVNPQLDDTAIDQKVNAVLKLITKNNGELIHTDHMGTRRLAYEIKGLTQGYYGSFIYKAPSNTPLILERFFLLEDTYLRNLTVCYEGDLEKLKEQPVVELEERREPVKTGGGRREEAPAPKPEAVKAAPAPKPEAVEAAPAPKPEAVEATPAPEPTEETKPASQEDTAEIKISNDKDNQSSDDEL